MEVSSPRRTVPAVIFMGFSGFIAQMLLLKELLAGFPGNELSIGIILANWLVCEAAGAWISGKVLRNNSILVFSLVQLAFAASLPLAVLAARMLPGASPGEAAGLLDTVSISMLVLLVPGMLHGALFPSACRICFRGDRAPDSSTAGVVYVLEITGTLAAGFAFTFLVIPHIHSLQAALFISLGNCIACILLLRGQKHTAGRSIKGLSAMAGIAAVIVIAGGYDNIVHLHTAGTLWPGSEILEYRTTPYGTLALTYRAGEYTWFSDRLPLVTSPNPDISETEGKVHLPLLHHQDPASVLIIGSGAGGVITEVLKHPVEKIDYAELNPYLIELLLEYPTELISSELGDKRVHTHTADGRLFALRSSTMYNIVIIGLPYPLDLQVNRLYTLEFYSAMKDNLSPGAILVMSLPGSIHYLSREMKDLNRSALSTLKEVFAYTKSIPGDGAVIHIASDDPAILSVDTHGLIRRYHELELETSMVNPAYITYRNDEARITKFAQSLTGGSEEVNRDVHPVGIRYGLAYWFSISSPEVLRPLRFLTSPAGLLVLLVGSSAALALLAYSSRAVHGCIIATGFSGMLFDLALIYLFQALYGYVYSWIGVLAASFMAGSAAGGWIMTGKLKIISSPRTLFAYSELFVTAAALLLGICISGLFPYLAASGYDTLLQGMFIILSFLAGFSTGIQFPLANRIAVKTSLDEGTTAGSLYGADLLGGWAAGIAGGALLLPTAGILGLCLVPVVMKVYTLVLFLVCRRKL